MKIHWLLKHVDEGGNWPNVPLHHAEAARLALFKSEKRRRDWLLGRQTAKQLLQQVLGRYVTRPLRGDELFIGNHETGEPFVSCTKPELASRPLTISISHGHDHALCAVAEVADVRLGADLERITPRIRGFANDYFTLAEMAQVNRAGPANRDMMINLIWSGKEAALKALHKGLSVDTRSVSCLFDQLPNPDGWRTFSVEIDKRRLVEPLPSLHGWWRIEGDLVITVVASRQWEN
ncbi:MAG: 4'-phosphopantetheinyl transferase superfamily protein [Ardenticatenaceae bacterium]|nr:4'-phosphopantetheinyl transferase superfamily protein [Ardenticatenaceae bacterium]